jgi:hypothetical protein
MYHICFEWPVIWEAPQTQYNSNNTATTTACDKNKIPDLYVSRFRKYKKATFDKLTTVIFKIFIF